MKKIIFSMLVSVLLFSSFKSNAQDWKIGGNTLNADGRLGSNNNHAVLFETNNIERGKLTIDGLWTFGGVGVPNARVHINTVAPVDPLRIDVSGIPKLYVHNAGGVSIGQEQNMPIIPPANGLYVFGNTGFGVPEPSSKVDINSKTGQNALKVFVGGATKFLVHNLGGVSIGSGNTPPNNGLYVSGSVAIGTTTASTKLHVSSIASSFIKQSPLRADVGGVTRLFGHFNGGLSVGSGLIPPDSGLYVAGSMGIGINAPAYQLQLSANSAAKPLSSLWTVASDQRLKKDIIDFTDGMNIIKKIHPVWYSYNGEAGLPAKERSVGTLAQELQKIAPYMVKNWAYQKDENSAKTDYLSVDYNALLFMFVNAFKEQEEKITTLEDRLAKMESMLTAILKDENIKTANIPFVASLEQNQPNPFGQTTIIRYKIPTGANAQIMVYDALGTMIKSIKAVANGQVQLNAYDLKPGTYTYTLIINGKTALSKKLTVMK